MTTEHYQSILDHLDSATRIVLSHQGELKEGDVRIRHLLSICVAETRRQLRETEAGSGLPANPGGSAAR